MLAPTPRSTAAGASKHSQTLPAKATKQKTRRPRIPCAGISCKKEHAPTAISASSHTDFMSYDATPNDKCFTKLDNAMLLLKMVSACTAPVAISCTLSSPRMKIL